MPEWPPHEPDHELEELDIDKLHDLAAEKADRDRKREKEDAYVPPPKPSDEDIRRRWEELNKSDVGRRPRKGR